MPLARRILSLLRKPKRALALLCCCASVAHTQAIASSPAHSAFKGWDVISVKPNNSGSGNMGFSTDDNSFRCENCGIYNLLLNAYGIHMHITGTPSWANGKRWDISAKIIDPDPANKDRKETRQESEARYQASLQAILKERFHLQVHTETKVEPIFSLVVARNGPRLKPASQDEKGKGSASWNNGSLEGTGIPLSDFADMISGEAGHNVVDKTGLAGDYDIKLRWSKDNLDLATTDAGLTDRPPTFFTALEEQLGLKLQPDKGPVTTLVVDSLTNPSED